MNKNMHSNHQNQLSLTIERPLNAKYYPLNDDDLNGRQFAKRSTEVEKNPILRMAIKLLSSIGFDL